MQTQEGEVKIARVFKSKNNKLCVTFLIGETYNDIQKGFNTYECWYESAKAYDSINKDLIGVPLIAQFYYKERYNNTAQKMIASVYDENGNVIEFE